MRVSLLLMPLLVACSGGDDDAGTPTDGSPTTDTGAAYTIPPREDTGFPQGDVGSLMYVQEDDKAAVYAIFVNQQPGFENLALCAVTGGTCLPTFGPDIDLPYDFDPTVVFAPEFSQYRYVGDTITFGPWTPELRYDAERGVGYYYADVSGEDAPLGAVGVSFGVQWGDYVGTDDIVLKPTIDLITPRAETVVTTNADVIPLEWMPMEDGGEIHLFATVDELFIGRHWTLEDDGYFDIPVDEIFSGAPPVAPQTIQFVVQRWNLGEARNRGNVLDIVQLSSARFTANYDYVGSRVEVEAVDNCAQAVNMTAIDSPGTYSYWGRMFGFGEDIGDQCGVGSTGPEGLITVDLPPLTKVAATYTLPYDDAAVWITTDCNVSDSCVVGANVNEAELPESVQTFNPSTTETVRAYLVLGGDAAADDIFTLDVTIEQLLDPKMADQCLEAQQTTSPLVNGSYYTEETAYLNSLDPGVSCTGTQTPGPDAMQKVTLGPGQTITALLQMPGADPAIYLLYNCTQPDTCAIGADLSVGPNEELTYTNSSGYQENLYLVVDSKGGALQPYFLSVVIQ